MIQLLPTIIKLAFFQDVEQGLRCLLVDLQVVKVVIIKNALYKSILDNYSFIFSIFLNILLDLKMWKFILYYSFHLCSWCTEWGGTVTYESGTVTSKFEAGAGPSVAT